tara:strand:+ start:10720 stop:12591 length:1872 start_codon:yes stop_codon:yes gene_type:complete
MATKSSQINITELDFDSISDNLKAYLKGQEKLKDYNFEGSTMATLIDLLAYSSHIGAVNTNIAASELFLDSAQIRKNVVSRAKDLGFTPASEKCSSAIIDIALNNVLKADGTYPTLSEMTIPRGHVFQTVFDGVSYDFVTTDTNKPTQNSSTFNYTGVEISQGTYMSDSFVYDRQIKNSKFVLSNERVDRSKLSVVVNSGGTSSTYALSTDISTITTTSTVYYTQENEEGYLEIYFGDGVLGKELLDGDIITATYIVVDTDHADGAKSFQQITSINGYSDSVITTTTNSTGGAEKESVESIKFKANKFFTSQNRLVTLNDYKAKVSEYYPNADAVAVWGGEDNNPPQYGKVFLAIKPKNSDYLTEVEKAEVIRKLNSLNMVTVRPEIINPEIIKILISTCFKYNNNFTTLSKGELEQLVNTTINQYDADNLSNFDSIFRHSNLVKNIDETDTSILSNITNIRLKKSSNITLNKKIGYTNEFGNAFYHPNAQYNKALGGILSSTGFKVTGDSVNTQYFDDDGDGNLRRYYLSGSTRIYSDTTAGTVDYTTGKITINALMFTSTVNTNTTIDFTIIPDSYDVVATRGSLVDISSADVTVKGEIDTIASGESSAGVGFSSTSSSTY